MSIKLANLNIKSHDGEDEEDGDGGVPDELPPVGVYSPLREGNPSSPTLFDFDETTSTSSDSGIWFHQAASEGSIDLVKNYVETLIKTYGEGTVKYAEERDRIVKGYSALHMAARYNRKNVVKYLLSKGAPINQLDDEDENTPLLLAAKYNMAIAAKVLLEEGADPLTCNKYGTYPLHYAARRGNDELCQMILDKPGVHVNQQVDKGGSTPLHLAMLGGSEDVVELMIRYGADVMANNVEGEQPIHFAAAEDAGDIIVLLAKGAIGRVAPEERESKQRAFVNTGTNEMDTALHIAAQGGFVETVKTLVHIGANVHKRTDIKQTPLHLAAINGHLSVVRFLVRSYAKIDLKDADQMTPLHKACQFGRLTTVQFLIEQGAKLDARDRDGFTPLMCAVWKGHNEVIEYLIEKKANMRIDDANNKCVLHLAIEEDHYDTLELLIKKGAKLLVDDVDKDYRSVLHYAAEKDNEDMLAILINNGATIDVADIEEKTPLHTAAEKGNVACVKYLAKESPGIVNATDGKGMSPLHLAADNGHIKVCETLIELGAEISCRDEWNWTPLDYASQAGYFKTMRVLLENDAPVDACDTNNTSPLHHASQNGHTESIDMLLDYGASIALKNVEGKNCLDLAVENFQKEACLTLINHSRWEETVKHLDKREPPPMKKLIQFAPDIAEIVLNRSVTKKDLGIEGRAEYATVYNFRYLDIHPEDQADGEEPYFGPHTMVKFNKDNLLSHPLTVKLINDKWARLGRWVYICSLTTYLLFVTLLTSLVVVEKDIDQDFKEKNIKLNLCHRGGSTKSKFTEIVPWLTLGVACFQIIKELCQALYLRSKYLKDPVNWFEFALYFSTILFMLPFILCQVGDDLVDEEKLDRLKWQAGAVSILFTWFNLLLYLKRFPFFGLYVLMFTEVLSTLLNVLCVFSILIVGFALSFYSLFKIPEQTFVDLAKNNVTVEPGSFRMVGTSLVRTMVMMIGELDYRAMFTENFPDEMKPLLPYKTMSYVVFILFVVIMTIVVMNLLVGLAIGDIESVRKNAYIRMLRGQVHILQALERTYPKFILKKVYKPFTEELPTKRKSKWKRFSDWLGSLDFDSLREDQMEITAKEELLRQEIESQKKELDKQKVKMKQMTMMIEEQSEAMKKIIGKLHKIPKDELKKLLA